MKNLKKFIKESIDNMLTFKDGRLDGTEMLQVSDRDKVTAMETFAKSELSDFSYEYYYESSSQPEGVLVTCNHSGKTYLVTHGNPGQVMRFDRR